MDTCLDLIALQYTCMIVMAMLAFFVFVSRYYVTCRNRQFEQSRWMIVVALLLFVVHYMCQMRLGWRQQGNDVGVLFNLLFYSPSAILLSWSQLNILRAGHRRWSFMRYGVVGYALMVLCIVAGVISNGSLHIGPMLYVADAIHFFTLLYYTWAPLRELGNVQRRLDSEHGNPADAYLRTGLDWKSGATRHRSILGKNNRANGAYAIIQYLANGDLLFNSVAGPIRVKY